MSAEMDAETLAELRRLLADHVSRGGGLMLPYWAAKEAFALLAERDALADAVARVRALHYAADNDAARTPICETCHGKAGVHECGCWADRDREPVCGHCMGVRHGASVPWPCPTIRALGGEADR